MAKKFRQTRWTKVHEQGNANFETHNNIMDIMIGTDRCQAEITYSTSMVRNFNKAAYWLLHSLEVAQATQAVQLAAEELRTKVAEADIDADEISASGDGWSCTIEKMRDGVFRVQMSWINEAESDDQLTLDSIEIAKPKKSKRSSKKTKTEQC